MTALPTPTCANSSRTSYMTNPGSTQPLNIAEAFANSLILGEPSSNTNDILWYAQRSRDTTQKQWFEACLKYLRVSVDAGNHLRKNNNNDTNAMAALYAALEKKWETDTNRYPSVMPPVDDDDFTSRIRFYSMCDALCDQEATTVEQHMERGRASFRIDNARDALLDGSGDLGKYYMGSKQAVQIEEKGREWRDGRSSSTTGIGILPLCGPSPLRLIIGHTFLCHNSKVEYTVMECYLAPADSPPVYSLEYWTQNSEGATVRNTKLVFDEELEEMMGMWIDDVVDGMQQPEER